MNEQIPIYTGSELRVIFYAREVVLKRSFHGFGAYERLVPETEIAEQGMPNSRSLSLVQAGSINQWCAQFAVRTPAVDAIRIEAWDPDPQTAIRKLEERIGLFISKIGWIGFP